MKYTLEAHWRLNSIFQTCMHLCQVKRGEQQNGRVFIGKCHPWWVL